MASDTLFGQRSRGGEGQGAHWLSVSDLMAGLMMVFLFIAIVLMRNAEVERNQIRDIAVAFQEAKVAIYESLTQEFEEDLERWDAVINEQTLGFEFRSPEVLFSGGSVDIQPRFEQILEDFFPRYREVLGQFAEHIDEIRVEGHTSSDWVTAATESDAYFNNLALSQGRTRSVLRYAYELPAVETDRGWIKATFAAVGLSSSRLVLDDLGLEDQEASRRVTFRVITDAEVQISRILEVRDE